MTSAQFLELALSLSVQAALVVIAAHWLGRLASDDRFQCRLWTACYAAMLVLIAVALLLPHPRWFQPWEAVAAENAATLVAIESQLGRMLFLMWLAGAVVSLLVFVFRSCQAHRFLQSCRPIDRTDLALDEECSEFPSLSVEVSGRSVRLLSSSRLATPFCWQFHHPYIVLPEFVLGLGRREFGFIVRHELEHLKTGHPLQLFLQRVVEVIFWFHPMVWWASQQSAECREYACDEAAVDSPGEISMYLRTLLTIVEYSASQATKTPTPLAFGRGSHIVAKRARRLVQIARNDRLQGGATLSRPTSSLSFVAAALLIALVWLPVDVLASTRASWTPWPTWSAGVLHNFGVSARDYDLHDDRLVLHELLEEEGEQDDDDRDSRQE